MHPTLRRGSNVLGQQHAGQLGTVSLIRKLPARQGLLLIKSIAQIVAGGNSMRIAGRRQCELLERTGRILGDGTTTSTWPTSSNVILPTGRTAISIDMHYQSACAILDDNSPYWGSNNVGQLGQTATGNSYDSVGGRISTYQSRSIWGRCFRNGGIQSYLCDNTG